MIVEPTVKDNLTDGSRDSTQHAFMIHTLSLSLPLCLGFRSIAMIHKSSVHCC